MVLDARANGGEAVDTQSTQACRADLNGDGEFDLAVLAPAEYGRELIALLSRPPGYDGKVLFRTDSPMVLACHVGKTIVETTAARRQGKTYNTPGAYVSVSQTEGASLAFFWDGSQFKEISLSD